MGTPQDNHSVDPARTGVQRLRDGLATSAALGATITVVAGTVLINGQPVGAVPAGLPTEVTALDDDINGDGTTSLREALYNAQFNSGLDTITFAPSLFVGGPAVIELDDTLHVRAHDVAINGPGSDMLTVRTVDGAEEPSNVDVLYFYGDMAVSVSNISIESTGDGISASGYYDGEFVTSVTLSGVDISARDRAISVSVVSGDVTVTDSTLSSTAGERSYGRPIASVYYVDGDVVFTNVEISADETAPEIDPFGPVADVRRGLEVGRVGAVSLTNVTTDTFYSGLDLNRIYSDIEISDSSITSVTGGVDVRYAGDLTITDTSITIDNDGMYLERFGPGGSDAVDARYLGAASLEGATLTGGGIDVSYASSLAISNSTITEAPFGAVSAYGVALSVTDSTISNSGAMFGDALIEAGRDGRFGPDRCLDVCLDSATADGPGIYGPDITAGIMIVNSTISGNTIGDGSAIIRSTESYAGPRFAESVGEEPDYAAQVTIESSTIAGNSIGGGFVPGPPPVDESDAAVVQATSLSIDHSIVTDNDDMVLIDSDAVRRFADAASLGSKDSIDEPFVGVEADYSILPAAVGPADGTNIFTDDPGLGDLADNGGSTETMMPTIDSPAVDAGAASSALPTDQRGEARPSGESNDIGAVERQASSVSISADPTSVSEADGTVAITVTRTGDGEGDASVRLSTADGTATADDDYTALDQVVVLPAGQASSTVDLAIATDDDIESNETLVVMLSDADNVSIDVDSVDVTITDSTTPPTTVPDTTTTTTTTTTVPGSTTTTTEPAVTTTTTTPLRINGSNPPAVAGGSQSSFTVTIEQGDDDDVDVSASSSDPSLLDVVSVNKKSQGNAFTRGSAELTEVQYEVRVQAAAGGSGTVTVTVTAEGDSGTATQDFQIEVSSQTLPATGTNTTQRTGLIGALLLGFGFVTSLFSRRRRA